MAHEQKLAAMAVSSHAWRSVVAVPASEPILAGKVYQHYHERQKRREDAQNMEGARADAKSLVGTLMRQSLDGVKVRADEPRVIPYCRA